MFRVLRSSAGAGKTHALVKNYLTLALAGNDAAAYSRILALTFTNKAAAEMRERILDYLEELGQSEVLSARCLDVRDAVMLAHGASADAVQALAQAALTHILHNWPRFAVSTIDAFTRRVVMPFARDLKLDSDLRMTTEEDHYRNMAVDRLLGEAGTDDALTELLTAVCEDLLEQERDWRVDKPLRELATQLTKEQAIQHLVKLRAMENSRFLEVRRALRSSTAAFRERMRSAARIALEALATEDLNDEDLAYGKNGVAGFLRKLHDFKDWMEPAKNAIRSRDADKWASTKADAHTRAAVDRVAPFLHDAVSLVEDARSSGALQRHAIAAAVLRDLLPSAALHLLDDRLERIKQEEGIAFFSDLVKKVAAIVQEEPAPFLYEKLGERFDHFLIDEFQDTSLLQWQSLLPLITNALSGTGTALLVGDAKQAIYRWRNGEARQFTELPLLFGKQGLATGEEHEGVLVRTHLPIAPLITNYRSARTIIRTNNQLFDALREKLPSAHRTVYEAQAQDEKQEALGHVHLRCYAPVGTDDDDEESAPAPPRFALECVTEALNDGFVAGDIAILVRTKAQGRAVADHLIAHGHQVVSPDGLTLGSDIAVRAMMAVFTWLHRPDDVMAAQALQAIALLRGAVEAADPFGGGSPHQLLAELCHAYPGIDAGTPLLPLLHAITDMLGVHPAHDAFVLGALNEANSFRQEHGDSPLAFIDHWKRVAEKRSVGGAPNDHAVRVMTVHASKGLQFPVVIVPWADMASRAPKDRVWIDPREVVPDLPAALIRPVKPLDELGIEEVTTEQELAQLDLMDLLYVSFTRPELRLYAGIDGKAKSGIAVWLREHFRSEPGQDQLIGPRDPAPTRKKAAITAQPITDVALPRRKATLAIRAEAPAEWDPADPDPFRTHGRALHAVLARVRTARDLDEAIRYEANVWGISASTQMAIRDLLNNVLTSPQLAPFFGEGVQVRTEAALIDADGHTIRPDRVISDQQRTRVLDIKTGASKDVHHDQVRHYAHVLRAAGEPEVSAHLLYLDAGAGTFDLIAVQP